MKLCMKVMPWCVMRMLLLVALKNENHRKKLRSLLVAYSFVRIDMRLMKKWQQYNRRITL
jgi:hypothetical protein